MGCFRDATAASTGYDPERSNPPMSLSPGTRVGSYEVTALIGQGGMGEV